MTAKRLLCVLALPALLGLGCYGHSTRVGVAYGTPPPPPAYYYAPEPRPGYVWVEGNWYWNSDQWAWRHGHWISARPGYVWMQGAWRDHTWYPGYWRPSGVSIRGSVHF
jgi:hypothetical protein